MMTESPIIRAIVLSLGFSFLAQVLVLIVSWVTGGFRIGFLPKSIEVRKKTEEELDVFIDSLDERLAECGFRPGKRDRTYIQDGQIAGDFSSFTHAKTPKQLSFSVVEEEGQYLVRIDFKYNDLIVADTGESAYRNALLDYLSGESEEMALVPNLSHAGCCGFAGSLLGVLLLIVTGFFHSDVVWLAIPFFCFISLVLSGVAIFSMILRPKELSGLLYAIIGFILNSVVIIYFLLKQLMKLF